ncbi:MAG TPA: trehalose-phosphatase [Gammaproteobacteria bacterium]|nr:trehalose-phosphatase [Gammaproteobacteria bacterium]
MSRSAKQNLPQPRADLAFFLDVDGTLLPLAETPAAVLPSASVCTLLAKLASASGGAVALISGRSLAEIDRLFCNQRFPAAGQHGGEQRNAKGRIMRNKPHVATLNSLRNLMRDLADTDERLLLEDKGLSLALHYRRAPECGPALMAKLQYAIRGYPEFNLQLGKMVLEVRPTGVSKAYAVQTFMSEPPFMQRVPVFIGDDITDEDGFAMVNQLGGISIKVGSGNSVAHYRFVDIDAVLKWLMACSTPTSEQMGKSNAQS